MQSGRCNLSGPIGQAMMGVHRRVIFFGLILCLSLVAANATMGQEISASANSLETTTAEVKSTWKIVESEGSTGKLESHEEVSVQQLVQDSIDFLRFRSESGQVLEKQPWFARLQDYAGPWEPVVEAVKLQLQQRDTQSFRTGTLLGERFQHPDFKDVYTYDRLHFHVPEEMTKESGPVGLVIMMHGGGRDTPVDHAAHLVTSLDSDPASVGLWEPFQGENMILVAPSAPQDSSTGARWNVPQADAYMEAVIEECCHRYPIDRDRIFLGGYSMGGFGAWHLCQRLQHRLAGGFVFSGAWKTMDWQAWNQLPIFIRHGKHDAKPAKKDVSGRPRFTDPKYSQWAERELSRNGNQVQFVLDDGDHALRPATDAMKQFAAWCRSKRRTIPDKVVAVSPRGWNVATNTACPDCYWIQIQQIGTGTCPVQQMVLKGPAPRFGESEEDFLQQSLEVEIRQAEAGRVLAQWKSPRQLEVTTENVVRFRLAFEGVEETYQITVDGETFSCKSQPRLLTMLQEYRRTHDWSLSYPWVVTFERP